MSSNSIISDGNDFQLTGNTTSTNQELWINSESIGGSLFIMGVSNCKYNNQGLKCEQTTNYYRWIKK